MRDPKGWFVCGSVVGIMALSGLCGAAVKGVCSDCHTMHNSQQGSVVAFSRNASGERVLREVPFRRLLKTDCVGCHSHTGSETTMPMGVSRVPIVFNMLEPTYPADGSGSSALAGGNFYWVAHLGDPYGHNVYGISGPDLRLGGAALAPGGSESTAGCSACHKTLATEETGCNGCHVPLHHAAGESQVVGGNGGWYRFLGSVMERGEEIGPTADGVAGIEDPNWEQNPRIGHNVYQGTTTPYGTHLDTKSISQQCAGCHGRFHSESAANSVWIRHPVDVALPTSGEFASVATYDPLVPVARQSVVGDDANFTSVRLGSDVVSCISCHRPHGSPYPAMLRWNYRAWPGTDPRTGTTAYNGCGVCHTAKD